MSTSLFNTRSIGLRSWLLRIGLIWLIGGITFLRPVAGSSELLVDPTVDHRDVARLASNPATDRNQLLDDYFLEIRDLPFNYGNVGSVLEAIAYIELTRIYPPPRYQVLANTEYRDANGRTVGELDILVYDLSAGHVDSVYEVKLTASPSRAGKHARQQLLRFQKYIKDDLIYDFMGSYPQARLEAADFKESTKYLLIGGSETLDYDWAIQLDIRRDEGDVLQERIRDYQKD